MNIDNWRKTLYNGAIREEKEGFPVNIDLDSFRLPAYQDIPDVGLYLEQTATYISQFLAPLGPDQVTGSMISNYVKKGLIENPVKKRYGKDQIAGLLFILLAKNVLSLDQLSMFMQMQKRSYSAQRAYTYFRQELENILGFVFGYQALLPDVSPDSSTEKKMLRGTIIALAHKIHLDLCFQAISRGETLSDH